MKPIPVKQIILCADDYGLNAAVSQGIINLLARQRLSAVSCLTTTLLWPEQAGWLKSFHTQADFGLHFNLTEGKPLSALYRERYGDQFFPLSRLIMLAFLRRLDPLALEQEAEAQLERFVTELGFFPDFIDGHQHVQLLPQVREALLRVYEKSLNDKKIYLRSVYNMTSSPGWAARFKKRIIYLCGAFGFQQLLQRQGIPHNTAFAGIYSFTQVGHYAQIFPQFLKNIKNKGLIMCHPGLESKDKKDAIRDARFQEYSYLSSKQFEEACQAYGIQLGRYY